MHAEFSLTHIQGHPDSPSQAHIDTWKTAPCYYAVDLTLTGHVCDVLMAVVGYLQMARIEWRYHQLEGWGVLHNNPRICQLCE